MSPGACREPRGKWLRGPRAVELQGFPVLLPGSAVLCGVWLAQIPWPSPCLAVRTLYGCLDGVVVECGSYSGSFTHMHVEQMMCPY